MDYKFNNEINNDGTGNSPFQTANNGNTGTDSTPRRDGEQPFNNQDQYMPYGNYNYKPDKSSDKKSKGKKAGAIIAIVLVVAALMVSAVLLGFKILRGGNSDKAPLVGDDTQLQLSETQKKEEQTSGEGPLSAKQVYQKVYESSVGVLVYTGNKADVYSEGTGVVMGANSDNTATYIITCAHVINVSTPKIMVMTTDGEQYEAFVVGIDEKTDIGVIRVEGTDLKPAEFTDSSTLEVGDTVYAIGNPGGTQFFGSFTNGMVSAIGRPVDSPVGYEVACIQHTAPINPGNSGGALVNEYGQVVGINSSKIASTNYEGMGFAVPSTTVKEIVDELIANGHVSNRPVLGIKYMVATQSQAYYIIVRANKLPAGAVVVEEIMNGSDLQNTDVQTGDMILKVNGKELDSYEVLADTIEESKVGDTLTLTIGRINSDYTVSIFDVQVKLVEDSTTSSVETPENEFPFPF